MSLGVVTVNVSVFRLLNEQCFCIEMGSLDLMCDQCLSFPWVPWPAEVAGWWTMKWISKKYFSLNNNIIYSNKLWKIKKSLSPKSYLSMQTSVSKPWLELSLALAGIHTLWTSSCSWPPAFSQQHVTMRAHGLLLCEFSRDDSDALEVHWLRKGPSWRSKGEVPQRN